MVATKDQIEFAQSRIDYFEKILKKGEGDKLKSLLKAIKAVEASNDLKAQSIATAIKNAKTVTQTAKNKAIQDAKDALEKVTESFQTFSTFFKSAEREVATLVKEIDGAITTINKVATDNKAKKTVSEVLEKLGFAEDDVSLAANKLTKINLDAMAKLSGEALCKAIENAKTAIIKASEKISDTNKPTSNLELAVTAAENITDKDIKSAVIDALKDATTVGNKVKEAISDANKGLVRDATIAETDCTTYIAAQKVDAAMVVGDDSVMTAAKALLGEETVTKIINESDAKKLTALFVDKAPEIMKNYGFINAILKNIPNKATDVLQSGSIASSLASGAAFANYASDTLKYDALKAGNAYFKIVATVCGTGPFKTTDLPERDTNSHHVKNCLDQANKIAYVLLQDQNCGNDKLENGNVKAECFKALADNLDVFYNGGNFDAMNIDLSGEYPYDKVFSELDAIVV